MKSTMLEINRYFNLEKVFSTIEDALKTENWQNTDLQLLDVKDWFSGVDGDEYLTITIAVILNDSRGYPCAILGTIDVTTPKDERDYYVYEYHKADNVTVQNKAKGGEI